MKYIEAPNYDLEIARLNIFDNLFLAGSITGAQDWQKEMAFKKYNVYDINVSLIDRFNVFNPRRVNFDASNPAVEQEQITWEYHCIHQCSASFPNSLYFICRIRRSRTSFRQLAVIVAP